MNGAQAQDSPHVTNVALASLVREHRRFIVRWTAVCTILIAAFSLVMRHTFEAGTKVVANETKSNPMSSLLGGMPAFITGGATGGAGSLLSMAEILQSRTNAEFIIRTCGLDTISPFRDASPEERRLAVLEALTVDTKRTSGVMSVTCALRTSFFPSAAEQQRTAELAARMCNAAIAGLDSANRLKTTSTARKTRLYIERVLATNRIRLDSLQTTMIAYQKEYHIFTPEKQAEALVSSAVTIGTELAKAETELRLGREQFQENTPYVRALESKVKSLQSQFSAAQNGGVGENDRLSIPVGTLPEISMGYLNLVRDIKILEQVNAYLESQRMQESIQEERDVPTIQVIDPALTPEKRSAPSRVWMVLLGGSISLLSSVLVLVLRQVFKRRPDAAASETASEAP
ncbi:MAG: GNVR domain-containing protein [Candidatus Kapaibacterium sp.]